MTARETRGDAPLEPARERQSDDRHAATSEDREKSVLHTFCLERGQPVTPTGLVREAQQPRPNLFTEKKSGQPPLCPRDERFQPPRLYGR